MPSHHCDSGDTDFSGFESSSERAVIVALLSQRVCWPMSPNGKLCCVSQCIIWHRQVASFAASMCVSPSVAHWKALLCQHVCCLASPTFLSPVGNGKLCSGGMCVTQRCPDSCRPVASFAVPTSHGDTGLDIAVIWSADH